MSTETMEREHRSRLLRGMELLREDMEECEPQDLPAKRREYRRMAIAAGLAATEGSPR